MTPKAIYSFRMSLVRLLCPVDFGFRSQHVNVSLKIGFIGLTMKNVTKFRGSHPEVFLGEGVLKICGKFTGEHPCWSAISIKLQSNFIKADEVNKILEEIFGEKGIPLIRNKNINSKRHLNRSRLHLNETGVSVLVGNFIKLFWLISNDNLIRVSKI